MDVCLVIKQRLEELGLEQKDLAAAAGVTDSYISQLLNRKKLPPAPERTDVYGKIGKFLNLPAGNLAELAEHHRKDQLRRSLAEPPAPLLKELRELILRKCAQDKQTEVRVIFEKGPFGELERLVTQRLLDVVKRVAKEELENEGWLKSVAKLNGRSYEEMRVSILEFLDTDIFNLSVQNCLSFIEPLIASWSIDLANFGMEIVLDRRLSPGCLKRLEFVERELDVPFEQEPGLEEFLRNRAMSADISAAEVAFLRSLRFEDARPTALYYYRELQNLRDPLNFRPVSTAPLHKHGEADSVEKQMQLHARKSAIQTWAASRGGRSRKK